MEFPLYSLDISKYQSEVKKLLNDSECAIFIDTNVISQLYRLNYDARQEFYNWIKDCGVRFHVPVWVIHEYSNKIHTNKTKDYLSELGKIKTLSKEFNNISDFVIGYVGNSLLKGSDYQDNTDDLMRDVDTVKKLLSKISNAINKNLDEQQRTVHEEISEMMSKKSLTSNIYTLISNIDEIYRQRYENRVPPGYKDASKEDNRIGDLIIWKEILEYCREKHVKKAILLSRDSKEDIVYRPKKQKIDNRDATEGECINIARESLVYEFKTITGGTDFHIIDFKTFVKIYAMDYKDLAKSFQIATAEEEKSNEKFESDANTEGVTETVFHGNPESENQVSPVNSEKDSIYLDSAIRDSQYDTTNSKGCMDSYIIKLKSHNWYIQNPTIKDITEIEQIGAPDTNINRSSVFVLGRNILQSAVGASGQAITYIENFSSYINSWEDFFKKALIDGVLFEIFFDSNAQIRKQSFKATFFKEIIENIRKLELKDPFNFINEKLKEVKERFVPEVGENTSYKFEFTISSGDTTSLKCNGEDISDTFKKDFAEGFAEPSQVKTKLMKYYAIEEKKIEVEGIQGVNTIKFIPKHREMESIW